MLFLYKQELKEAALVQASVKHQVDLVKLRCENNKLQAALQKAIDDKECTHIEVAFYSHNAMLAQNMLRHVSASLFVQHGIVSK